VTGKFVRPWNIQLGKNAETDRVYSGANAFRLMFEERACGTWATFKQWNKLGYSNKGAKGVAIWSPPIFNKDENGKDTFQRPPRVYHIYNAEDVKHKETGDPYPWQQGLNNEPRIAAAEELFAPYQHMVEISMNAAYSSTRDVIYMPVYTSFINAEEYYAVMAHELIHSTGTKERLNRPSLIDYHVHKASRAYEELIAEFGSTMICASLNIHDVVNDNALAYLQSWAEVIDRNPTLIKHAVGFAVEAVKYIMNGTMLHTEETAEDSFAEV
jgi:antirestriction protein ArdC